MTLGGKHKINLSDMQWKNPIPISGLHHRLMMVMSVVTLRYEMLSFKEY